MKNVQNDEIGLKPVHASTPVFHAATLGDKAGMAALRTMLEPNKGRLRGAAARGPYDDIMSRVAAPDGVTFEAESVGGVPGWWCKPQDARSGEAICHFHGGWFTFGSAQAFRHLVGHIAAKAGVAAFIPDYRLAPEHAFPAAVEDARACFGGLVEKGFRRIAVTGDSAGGCLALLLIQALAGATDAGGTLPVGSVVLSPVTDLTLAGPSWVSRAEADPYFTKPQVNKLVEAYLVRHDPADPAASPLYGSMNGLPPIRFHVGNDEVLLDDSLRFFAEAAASGVDAKVDVWECMAHGFLSGIGKFAASAEALESIGDFLKVRLTAVPK